MHRIKRIILIPVFTLMFAILAPARARAQDLNVAVHVGTMGLGADLIIEGKQLLEK